MTPATKTDIAESDEELSEMFDRMIACLDRIAIGMNISIALNIGTLLVIFAIFWRDAGGG